MPTIKRRFLFTTLAVMIIAAACGTFVGYYLARYIAVRATASRLDQYASRIMAIEEATSLDLRIVLTAINASRYRTCSNTEIDHFRKMIFASAYLKDVGHMRNGKIECSAALGRLAQSSGQAVPDFTQLDGAILYKNLAPYQNNGLATIALQSGGAFVVYTPLARVPLEQGAMHYTETVTDARTQTQGRLLGELPQVNAKILTLEGRVRIGDKLYATRCSRQFFNCVTAYTSIPEVMQADRARYIGVVALFRLLGGLLGLALSLLHHRYMSIEHQLRRAIRSDELCLVYQPIVQLQSKRMIGAETLARWTNKRGVAVGPDVFIKIAEKHGFIGEITRWVVRQALRDFGEILRSHPRFRLSINATAADLVDENFLPMLIRSLDKAKVPARCLAIEITESSTIMRKTAIETIRCLRARGHSVHIDDFGTGYSNLSYLHDLSIDAIKIDKSFTQAIGTGSVTVAILPQILAMAEALKVQVIVEGVETDEQADYFVSAGLPVLAQGWLYGHPVSADKLQAQLAEDDKKGICPPDADADLPFQSA